MTDLREPSSKIESIAADAWERCDGDVSWEDVYAAVQMAYEIGYREGSQDAVKCDCGKPRIIGWCFGPCDKDE